MSTEKKKHAHDHDDDDTGRMDQQEMTRFHVSSRPNRLVALEVGESDSICRRLNFDDTTLEDVRRELQSLKGTMSKAATSATQRSGNKYTVESGEFRSSHSGHIILVCVVTRVS